MSTAAATIGKNTHNSPCTQQFMTVSVTTTIVLEDMISVAAAAALSEIIVVCRRGVIRNLKLIIIINARGNQSLDCNDEGHKFITM